MLTVSTGNDDDIEYAEHVHMGAGTGSDGDDRS